MGQEKSWLHEMKKSLQDVKRYFKTGYRNHCQQDGSAYPDYCLKFALSDPNDSDLEEQCAYEHTTSCGECDEITIRLDKIEHVIKGKDTKFYRKEQQEDILYDFDHSVESTYHENNKPRARKAMKFFQIRFREKQSDWYGKRGLSWHVSSVLSRDE